MPEPADRRILDAGDQAFVVEFGSRIDRALFAEVEALDSRINNLHGAGALPGLVETVPTFRSLAVIFDPLVTSPAELMERVDAAPAAGDTQPADTFNRWELPVRYGGAGGPDLEDVARQAQLSAEQVRDLHLAEEYSVYMLGFQPGYAFMGDLPEALRLPRRTQPRTRVPRGSVAIANQLTGVYPWESPGGWHLLGYCPVRLFDAARAQPALLKAGDRVRFRSVDQHEITLIEQAIDADSFSIETLRGL